MAGVSVRWILRSSSLTIGLLVLGVVCHGPNVLAADLIEPPDPGFSEVDVFIFTGDAPFDSGGQVYTGFGLPRGLSVWVGADLLNGGPVRSGVNVMVTRTLCEGMDLDVWLDLGVHSSAHEAEIGRADWTVGSEWSMEVGSVTPYLRMDWYDDGAEHVVHLLSGLLVPIGRVDLHLELSSEKPHHGSWPLHVAIGPNVALTGRVELQPELSLLRYPGSSETHWAVSLGLVIDPHRLGS